MNSWTVLLGLKRIAGAKSMLGWSVAAFLMMTVSMKGLGSVTQGRSQYAEPYPDLPSMQTPPAGISRWLGPKLKDWLRQGSTITVYVPSTTPIIAFAASVGTNIDGVETAELVAGGDVTSAEQAASNRTPAVTAKRLTRVGAFIGINMVGPLSGNRALEGGRERRIGSSRRH